MKILNNEFGRDPWPIGVADWELEIDDKDYCGVFVWSPVDRIVDEQIKIFVLVECDEFVN